MLDYSLYFKDLPIHVRSVALTLNVNGFEAYLVGGCVRDHIMGRNPNDYDITTNATPEQIIALFPRTFYENSYGTVGVVTANETETDESKIKDSIIEVTPFRIEAKYEDGRHPSSVSWGTTISDDLKRRDFTCNALAYDLMNNKLIDEFEGIKDIDNKIIRAVGDAKNRFDEDGLRLLRAIRFAAYLDFKIEVNTYETIKSCANNLSKISKERIRDEWIKMLMTNNPKRAMEMCHETGVLKYIIPELENGIGVDQNQAHAFDVWEHNLRTCQHAADKNWPLELRLSAILHDISKPETRRFSKEKNDYTFYGHDVVGGRVARDVLERLHFPKDTVEYVSNMVRWHMFFSDTEQITLSAVKRLINNIGKENIWDLVNLRICDRIGTGRPKEEPYRLRMYESMIEQALSEPFSLQQLKINGEDIMNILNEKPGIRIGLILNAVYAAVVEDATLNETEKLKELVIQYSQLSIDELKTLASSGKDIMSEQNKDMIKDIRRKFKVK